jgi:GNAT superfamily N-acetyltransferase
MSLIRNMAKSDYSMIMDLLVPQDLGTDPYDAEGVDVIVADDCGQVVGVAEYNLNFDFGRPDGRAEHPGEQGWIFTIAVTAARRRSGLGQALLTEVARRAHAAGRTYLALVPQDGDDASGRRAFFRACGLALIEPDTPGAAWGASIAEILAAEKPLHGNG